MISKYLGDREFWRVTLSLAVPIAFQNLLISSFSLVDTIMVGQLGDIPLAAVGMAGQWSWLMGLVLFGLCSGSAVFVAQYWGINDRRSIQKVLGVSLCAVSFVALVFLLSGLFMPERIVGVFNSDKAVIAAGASYLRIAVFSYPAVALNYILSTILRSTENVRVPVYASGISTILNCVLNYVLIFGAFGVPEMGVRGAAVATCISSWTAPLFIWIISYRQRNIIIGRMRDIFGFDGKMVREYLSKAMPVMINEGLWGLGTVAYNVIFGRLGYEYYAAVTILKTFTDISFIFFIGLCSACCVIVGKSIGSGRIEKGYSDALRFSVVVPLLSLVVGSLIMIFRYPLVGLFNLSSNLTEITFATAAGIMLVVGAELVLRNFPYIQIVGIIRSGGDTVTGMKYDLVCQWVISLPLTYIAAFVLRLPFVAVYSVMLLAEDVLKVFLCLRRFVSRKWIMPVTEEGRQALLSAEE
jgi:putative MATE family efflux protein